jgi:signal transduction histidine kinase
MAALWGVVFAAHLLLSALGLPLYLRALREVCTTSSCEPWQPTAETIALFGGWQTSVGVYAVSMFVLQMVYTLLFLGLALALYVHRRGDPFTWALAMAFVMIGTLSPAARQVLFDTSPVLGLFADFSASMGWAAFFVLVFYLFPDGRFVPPWSRWLVPLWVVVNLPAALSLERFAPSSPVNYEHWPPPVAVAVLVGLLGSGMYAQARRFRRSADAEERQRIKWVLFGLAVAVVGAAAVNLTAVFAAPAGGGYPGVLMQPVGASLTMASFLMVPGAMTIAILRHRLWDIDLLINRTLVYGVLTIALVGLYVAVVGALGSLFAARGNLLVSLVATGLIAVLFAPTRVRLQRAVNRLTYGDRDEPYQVLSRLGRHLEQTLPPDQMLATIVQTVADALRVPYVALEATHDGSSRTLAAVGEPTQHLETMPLQSGGEHIGTLTLAPRRGESGFSGADRALLDDLARQIGVAVHALHASEEAVRLSLALQRSRELLVTAREEERRRLRRDLHDGLGPMLGSLTLNLDVAADLLDRDPDRARQLLEELKHRSRTAVGDIRELVQGLRPPMLDERGLIAAIEEQAARLAHDHLRICVHAPAGLGDLPAAVEVAAYRITQEALTNVARHADASRCVVRAAPDQIRGGITIEISDDGKGMPPGNHPAGVGISSMRERAAELGGVCVLESLSQGGTRVTAWLPPPQPEEQP